MDQNALATAAVVPRFVIDDFEACARGPNPLALAAIRRVLERAGVEFIEGNGGGGPGVRLRKGKP